jgi:hypothetical protein
MFLCLLRILVAIQPELRRWTQTSADCVLEIRRLDGKIAFTLPAATCRDGALARRAGASTVGG